MGQTRAIGELTVNFNWMEYSFGVIIHVIVAPEEMGRIGLIEPLINHAGFRQRLLILKELLVELSQQYEPSAKMHREYDKFCFQMKELMKEAQKLNDFRNDIIHWRPFVGSSLATVRQPKVVAGKASEIREKARSMYQVGNSIFARAVFLYDGNHVLTFGTHIKQKVNLSRPS
jgi:hypothetical protein